MFHLTNFFFIVSFQGNRGKPRHKQEQQNKLSPNQQTFLDLKIAADSSDNNGESCFQLAQLFEMGSTTNEINLQQSFAYLTRAQKLGFGSGEEAFQACFSRVKSKLEQEETSKASLQFIDLVTDGRIRSVYVKRKSDGGFRYDVLLKAFISFNNNVYYSVEVGSFAPLHFKAHRFQPFMKWLTVDQKFAASFEDPQLFTKIPLPF